MTGQGISDFLFLLSHNFLISNETTDRRPSEVIVVVRVISFLNRISYNELRSCWNFEIIYKFYTRIAQQVKIVRHLMWTDRRFLCRFWCDLRIEFDVQRFNFSDLVKGARIINSCKWMKAGRAKQASFLISLTTFHISMHLRRSLMPISIYIGIDICKVKNRVSTVEIQAAETSSDSGCLVHKKTFVSASSWSQINSDTHLIRPSFRINLKMCVAQLKKLAGGNKCALHVIDQYSNKNLTLSDLFWSFLKYFFHCFGRCCSLFSILTCIVQSSTFLFHIQEIYRIYHFPRQHSLENKLCNVIKRS